MALYNLAHLGEVIREARFRPLHRSVTVAAEGIGVSRQSLSELFSGRMGVSAETVIWLEKAG
jgi:antitoxin HigA-1